MPFWFFLESLYHHDPLTMFAKKIACPPLEKKQGFWCEENKNLTFDWLPVGVNTRSFECGGGLIESVVHFIQVKYDPVFLSFNELSIFISGWQRHWSSYWPWYVADLRARH